MSRERPCLARYTKREAAGTQIFHMDLGQDPDFRQQYGQLDRRDRMRVDALMREAHTRGPRNIRNENKCRNEGDGIWTLKPTPQLRLPFFYRPDNSIVVTHMFRKKRNEWPPEEKKRALTRRKQAETLPLCEGDDKGKGA